MDFDYFQRPYGKKLAIFMKELAKKIDNSLANSLIFFFSSFL